MENNIFPLQLTRGLTDRTYEKRKASAHEIERMVREHEKDPERITDIIDTLVQEFVYANSSSARYGGLIGLAATAIALGPGVAGYLDIIVPPILSCFSNQDQKVRYYACESMYNIAKVAKGEVLRFFNSIFDALCKLSADSEMTVKSGAELLDRLIKDVVSELSTTYVSPHQPPLNPNESDEMLDVPSSLPRNTAFSLPRFVPLLSSRIHVRNSNSRQYLVSWIAVLDSIPDLELVSFLPQFLDGLIQCLSDQSEDVRVATSVLLENFLQEIRQAAEAKQRQEQQELQDQQQSMDRLEPPQPLQEAQPQPQHQHPHPQRQHQQPQEPRPPSHHPPLPQPQTAEHVEQSHHKDSPDPSLAQTLPEKVEESTPDPAEAHIETTRAENDGHGKGTYIPGQGVTVKYDRIVEILIPHLSSPEEDIQRTALQWIHEFISIAKDVIIQFAPEIVKAVLPSLAHKVVTIRNSAMETNKSLQKLILEISMPREPAESASDTTGRPSQTVSHGGSTALLRRANRSDIGRTALLSAGDPFDYQAMVGNLRLQFLDEHEETRVASLEWLLMLHKKTPNKILASDDGTFPALLKMLSDSSEEVVCRDLQLLAQISSYSDDVYFRNFMVNLLLLFSTDRRLLETRGSLIIRQLCMSLDPERIYSTIAEILERDEDLEFASIMIQNLNLILITAAELSDLRKRLRTLDQKDSQQLFIQLYRSWCHNAIATFSLCLLAQAYEHASNMLLTFAELEITVNMLIQVDKLVQLLESPVFTYLRLQLLEPEKYPYLFKCLYGILMLLPQSSAFTLLRSRLSSVSSLGFLHVLPKSPTAPEPVPKRGVSAKGKGEESIIKFQELLVHFGKVQSKHEWQRRQALQNSSRINAAKNRRTRLANGAPNIAVSTFADSLTPPSGSGTKKVSVGERFIKSRR